MKKPSVLIADDHKIVLEGLRSLLQSDYEILGEFEDGRTLVAEAERPHPDLVVADISMPNLNGIDAARRIKKIDAGIRIIFLTMHADVTYATDAFEAGASGFVLKHSAPQELISAIREAMQGHTYVTPMIAGDLIGVFQSKAPLKGELKTALSPRQREVLQLIAEGKSIKEAAAALNISTRTAEFHKYRIMEQLNIKTTAGLVQYAVRHGVISI